MRHTDYANPPDWHSYPAGLKPSTAKYKRDFKCRICSLKRPQSTRHYGSGEDKHYGNYPTHCPVWAKLPMEEKIETAERAGYCMQCMRHDYTRASPSEYKSHLEDKCGVNMRRNKYTCLHDDCLTHSWVCKDHREENKPLFNAHMSEMGDRGNSFNFLTRSPPPYRAAKPQAGIPTWQSQIEYVLAGNPNQPQTVTIQADVHQAETIENPGQEEVPQSEDPPQVTRDRHMSEILIELKAKTPPGEELCTKLKEPPLFMFSSMPGKDSDVSIFYDGGNSHCLFDEGTPENLYGVKLEDGPHELGAVGATVIEGGASWICQPMTTKGRREILIGIEVKDITTPFPQVDLREATADIKANDPDNAPLQALTVPPSVGGVVNVLLGIQYNAHFPRLVHQLESGLGIYEVKLSPGSENYTAAIAGPHHSFDLIMDHVGGALTMLASFRQGLDRWTTEGPPPIKSICYSDFLSYDELQASYAQRKAELTSIADLRDWEDIAENCPMAQLCPTHKDLEDTTPPEQEVTTVPGAPRKTPRTKDRIKTETRDDILDGVDEILTLDSEDEVLDTAFCAEPPQPKQEGPCAPTLCNQCHQDIPCTSEDIEDLMADLDLIQQATSTGETLCREGTFYRVYNVSNTQAEDTDLATMKHYTANLESLIKIEYRCPRCRNCQPCRSADETEKISLREEAEKIQVEDSVWLDEENKRFMCKLPLRGDPEEFLSTNKHQAEKVLDRQVRLYANDDSTKPLILKAMKKLFDNGHVDLLNNLPTKTKQKILEQPVNHFIPWRVVFKSSSISTPARPVFDCSTRTPITSEGKGGRCLNDLMCKGRNMSFNLTKMLLRFSIGSAGLSGDIKQFYNVFKLEEDFWHLQLFLWKEELKTDAPTQNSDLWQQELGPSLRRGYATPGRKSQAIQPQAC